jgi:formate dehydrogenase subunit gamma
MHTDVSPSERTKRIAAIIAPYLALEGPAMRMLHAIQAAFGYVPGDAVPVVAHALDVPLAEILGLVSLHHDFRHAPAGRTVLKLCRAEACQSRGADRLAAHAQHRLGITWHATTPDGAVTLEPIFCLGLCAAAPCAMVNHRTITRLDIAKLNTIIDAAK